MCINTEYKSVDMYKEENKKVHALDSIVVFDKHSRHYFKACDL